LINLYRLGFLGSSVRVPLAYSAAYGSQAMAYVDWIAEVRPNQQGYLSVSTASGVPNAVLGVPYEHLW